MDDNSYSAWCPLHVRAAKGDTLNAEERALYEEGVRRLHEEEVLDLGSLGKAQTALPLP